MRVNKKWAFLAVVAIIIGGSLVASYLGLFDTESEKEAVLIKTGEFEGQADPNDIRGSYSFKDIEDNFGVSPSLLAKAFTIDGTEEEIASYQCKGLEEKYADAPEEIGTSSVRLFVGYLLGLPVEEGAFLPKEAVDVLLENAVRLTDERKQYLSEHTVDLSSVKEDVEAEAQGDTAAVKEETTELKDVNPVVPAVEKVAAAVKESIPQAAVQSVKPEVADSLKSQEATMPATEPVGDEAAPATVEPAQAITATGTEAAPSAKADTEHTETKVAGTIKGSTTISDLVSWGVKREEIGPAIGIELPSDNGAKLRDLIIAAGKSFDEEKIVLQKLVDDAK